MITQQLINLYSMDPHFDAAFNSNFSFFFTLMFSTQSDNCILICPYFWHHIFICCWIWRAKNCIPGKGLSNYQFDYHLRDWFLTITPTNLKFFSQTSLCLHPQYKYLVSLCEKEIWSYRTISPFPTGFLPFSPRHFHLVQNCGVKLFFVLEQSVLKSFVILTALWVSAQMSFSVAIPVISYGFSMFYCLLTVFYLELN